jgi:hypothetical protein
MLLARTSSNKPSYLCRHDQTPVVHAALHSALSGLLRSRNDQFVANDFRWAPRQACVYRIDVTGRIMCSFGKLAERFGRDVSVRMLKHSPEDEMVGFTSVRWINSLSQTQYANLLRISELHSLLSFQANKS